jgi:hypothetical protein
MTASNDRPRCPKGHSNLQLRCIVDFPAHLSADGEGLEPDLSAPADVDMGDTLGVDCGAWCPECEEWYWPDECLAHPISRGKGSRGA